MEKQFKSRTGGLYIFVMMILGMLWFFIIVVILFSIINAVLPTLLDSLTKLHLLAFLGALFVIVIYVTLRAMPRIIINTEGIRFKRIFGSALYRWEDIYGIKLSGKRTAWFSHVPLEAIVIEQHDFTQIPIWADAYRNTAQMRDVFQRAMKLAKQPGSLMSDLDLVVEGKDKRTQTYVHEAGRIYKGNFLFTFCGSIACIGIVGVLISISLVLKQFSGVNLYIGTVVLVPSLLLWFLSGMQLCYFELTAHYLIVRNQLFWWQRKIYLLSDIEELAVDDVSRRATCIRIIGTGIKDCIHAADSLRVDQWRALIRDLRAKGVNVRDEAFDPPHTTT